METLHTAIMVTGVPKNEHCITETNYVDLGSSNTVKVTFASEGKQRAIFKHKVNSKEQELGGTDQSKERKDSSSELSDMDLKIESLLEEDIAATFSAPEETDYTDMYLNSRCESESESEDGVPNEGEHDTPVSMETESHYITTHEIQLTELDHDMDHELGRAASSCWDYEDDNLVYSFVDYASFKSGEQSTGERGHRRAASCRPPKLGAKKALISTESECASSDDGTQNTVGHIHVPTKASSQTVSQSVGPPTKENNLLHCYHETHAKVEVPYDSHTDCFIPAPRRQHLASKLMKGKDVTEYSSGASSSVSEFDDADKEVRNLTAKSFRSLACPYFDTIDLRPSSESSFSEHSLSMNKWSSFNYKNSVMQAGVMGENQNSTCSEEKRTCTETGTTTTNSVNQGRNHQTNTCNTEEQEKSIRNMSDSHKTPTNQSCDKADDDDKDVHQKAMFASSHVQNVISKKMPFEQEHKSECGEIQGKHKDGTSCELLQRTVTELESVHSVVSEEEDMNSLNPAFNEVEEDEREETYKTSCTASTAVNIDPSLLDDHRTCDEVCEDILPQENNKSDINARTAKDDENTMIKTSHVYFPGSHFLSKESEVVEPSTLTKQTDSFQSDKKRSSPVDASNSGKVPEITIRLHGIRENNLERPFKIASLLTPNLTGHCGHTKMEKVPHFTVRDFRGSRCKLQTPIHQVRDVRKLVKSSYRLVSPESGENKTPTHEDTHTVKKEPDKTDKTEKTPIVIKCHSVNTNRNANLNMHKDPESERSVMQPVSEQPEVQMKLTRWKESCDKRDEYKMTNQVALEKIKAAVKTMEQLYVFDRNEWRRKTEAPRQAKDSHVLSLLTRDKQKDSGETSGKADGSRSSTFGPGANYTRTFTHHMQQDIPKVQCPSIHGNISRSTRSPLSLKICPLNSTTERKSRVEGEHGGRGHVTKSTLDPLPKSQPPADPDSENYLTIPIKPQHSETKHNTSEQIFNPTPQPQLPSRCSPLVTDSWSPESPTLTFCQPTQVLCVTPPTDTSNTQRKLLLDPITGQYYLVDTTITLQPVTQKLYCPENAQYLDVPVALSPVAYFGYPPTFVQPHSPPVFSQGHNTGALVGGANPVNNITSQQGPRIVAPPSFSGTTMSFAVEHG